jgi:hypothetical protein
MIGEKESRADLGIKRRLQWLVKDGNVWESEGGRGNASRNKEAVELKPHPFTPIPLSFPPNPCPTLLAQRLPPLPSPPADRQPDLFVSKFLEWKD